VSGICKLGGVEVVDSDIHQRSRGCTMDLPWWRVGGQLGSDPLGGAWRVRGSRGPAPFHPQVLEIAVFVLSPATTTRRIRGISRITEVALDFSLSTGNACLIRAYKCVFWRKVGLLRELMCHSGRFTEAQPIAQMESKNGGCLGLEILTQKDGVGQRESEHISIWICRRTLPKVGPGVL